MHFAIYARYSSDLQRPTSIDDQVRVCRERVAQLGGIVAKVYSDAAISGAALRNRPGMLALLAEAKHNPFDRVIAEALDRLSRDQEDIAAIYKRLSHLGISIVTLAEQEISELHIGLKGTMNALFLKDMAAKVRRGQRGRAAAGSAAAGICYGYKIVREIRADGELVRGKRAIDADAAAVIRRIFKDYIAGISPRAIASALNREGIRSPRGGLWGANTIVGSRGRQTGILENPLYVGRLVYNRQSFRKDPDTGRRIGRMNPETEWVIKEVPELRIVEPDVWEHAKARKALHGQHAIHHVRRPRRLLSSLVRCSCCGGLYSISARDTMRCVIHRDKGACQNGRTLNYPALERRVLDGLRERLLAPDLFAEFAREFRATVAQRRAEGERARKAVEQDLRETTAQIHRIVDAIAEGTDTADMRLRLKELDARKTALAAKAAARAAPGVVELHPNLPKIYRRKVADLQAALNRDPVSRAEAVKCLRTLIEKIVVVPGEKRGETTVELHGHVPAILAFAAGPKRAEPRSVISLVAAEGFEPPTKGL